MEAYTGNQLKDRRCLDNRRVKARLLDWLVVEIPIFILCLIVLGPTTLAWAISLALSISYFYLCESTTGMTLGKYRMGLRVIKPDGDPPGANSVAARNILRPFEEPLLALIVMVLSRGRRQRVGDFVGTTAVGSVVYSVPPKRSAHRFIYPPIWIACAVALVLLIGSPEPGYLQQANEICAANVARFADHKIPVQVAIRERRRELHAISALEPGPNDYFRHQEIVALKRRLVDASAAVVAEAKTRPDPSRAFVGLWQPVRRLTVHTERQLRALGLHCDPTRTRLARVANP